MLVDAIQACGGQKTNDGNRFRSGGGILWNIIKARDPNAYKEIMKKGREFEKQLKQQVQEPLMPVEAKTIKTSTTKVPLDTSQLNHNQSNDLDLSLHDQSQQELSTAGEKRASVHERIQMPVIYDDDLLGREDSKDKLA